MDKFGYNEGSISGPILFTKDDEGNKVSLLLGLFLSGNYTYQHDPRPTFGGNYKMRDEVREQILANPLRQNISFQGSQWCIVQRGLLTADDFERIPTRPTQPTRTPASWPKST